jgi:glycosyltransferase involved in cell wall biosynthesis
MNIVVAGQAFFQEDNGQAAFTVRLCRGLAEAGHQVTAFAPAQNGKRSCENHGQLSLFKVPAVHLAHNANISYNSTPLIHHVMATEKPAIVHIQDHYFLSRSVFREARRQNLPTVGSNHFLPRNLTDNFKLPRWMLGPVHALLWRHMRSLYNRLEAISTPTKTAAAILTQQNLKPPIDAISCGVDIRRFSRPEQFDSKEVRRRYGADPHRDTLIYIGRIDREKGLATMVEAMARLHRSDLQFIIGGKGSFLGDLKKMVQNLQLADRVILPGFIPAEDLTSLLSSSDCFVMAGHAELQSIASLEAMACALPVLAADAQALPELVTPNINGELFAPENIDAAVAALNRFLGKKNRWREMGRKSRERAEQHSLERTITAYVHWYQTVLGHSSSGS